MDPRKRLVAILEALEGSSDAKRRRQFEDEVEEQALMKNFRWIPSGRQLPLVYRDKFGLMTEDPAREYCKKLTHMYSWEILELAELCRAEIEKPRHRSRNRLRQPNGNCVRRTGRPPKADYINRLLYVLEWLSSGATLYKCQFDTGVSKSTIQEDRAHVLKAINTVLANEIRWPDEEERQRLRSGYTGIFEGVVGIMDVTEHGIQKSQDNAKESATYSGKAGMNTMKTLAVINKHGEFIYVEPLVDGRRNDRDEWTYTDLYLSQGKYFSAGEKIASDGGFRGDGPLLYSYDVINTDEKMNYNLAFKEVRVGIENAFGRVQLWFPLLGVEKKQWPYDDKLLGTAVEAACKLHNWMIRHRRLSYNAEDNPRNFYRDMY